MYIRKYRGRNVASFLVVHPLVYRNLIFVKGPLIHCTQVCVELRMIHAVHLFIFQRELIKIVVWCL